MNEDIKTVLLTSEQLQKRIKELGEQLCKDYAGKKVVMIVLLKMVLLILPLLSAWQ
jgi:hypoxanthine phosphoribosyltransferase